MTPSSSVTPEAAPDGMPPEGAASPVSSSRTTPSAALESYADEDVAPVTPRTRAYVSRAEETEAEPDATADTAEPPRVKPKPRAAPEPVEEPAYSQPAPKPRPAPVVKDVKWNNVFGNKQPARADTPRPPPSIGSVAEVRVGDHQDKTRIVLDMTTTETVAVSLEDEGMRLVIDLPQLDWTGSPSWSAETAQLVSGWTYKNGKLYVDLLYPAVIKNQQVLEGSASALARLVVDLYSEEVHQP